MLKKVISGGQTGADEAGLVAAEIAGLETGGTAPKGYRTQNGSNPELKSFGLVEHESRDYQPRTEENVKNSDGTIRLATDLNSAGEKLTYRFITYYGKPKLDIDPNNPPKSNEIVKWIRENNIETLNIAGNSEKTSPGIFDKVERILLRAFRLEPHWDALCLDFDKPRMFKALFVPDLMDLHKPDLITSLYGKGRNPLEDEYDEDRPLICDMSEDKLFLECEYELAWSLLYMNFYHEDWDNDQKHRIYDLCRELNISRKADLPLVHWRSLYFRIREENENMC